MIATTRARGRSRAWATLLAFIAVLEGSANAAGDHDHEHPSKAATAEASQLDPKTTPVASRLWNDLVCLCGRCERLTLAACRCPDAAAERKKVLELLGERDLATPAGAEAAYQVVVQTYVARFGGRHVLASEKTAGISGIARDWIVLTVAATVACGAILVFALRHRRSPRSRGRSHR